MLSLVVRSPCGGIGRRGRLKSCCPWTWEFESPWGYHQVMKRKTDVTETGYGPLIAISLASFLESVISPVPVDPALVGLLVQNPHWRHRLWICVSGASVVGACVSYAIGFFLYEAVGRVIVDFYHLSGAFDSFCVWVQKYGFWVMLLKPFLPLPFKVAAMVFGVAGYNFWLFVVATVVSRPVRFCVVTYLVVRFGMRYRDWILRHLSWLRIGYMVAIIGFLVLLAIAPLGIT